MNYAFKCCPVHLFTQNIISDTNIVFPEKKYVKMEMTAYLLQGLKYGV